MTDQEQWEGKPSELLAKLAELAGSATKANDWPKRANTLSGQLKRLAPNLRKIGLEVRFGSSGRGKSKGRRITIRTDKAENPPSPPPPPSPTTEKQGSGDDPSRNGDDTSRNGDDSDRSRKIVNSGDGNDGDGGDGPSPRSSESGTDREVFDL